MDTTPDRWNGCRCGQGPGYCMGLPNYAGPSAGALCADCDGSADRPPHVARPPGWRPAANASGSFHAMRP